MAVDAAPARSFAVVTDSTADIPPDMAAERGISVVPLMVSFGSECFPDGQLSQQEFFDRMNASPTLPTTSQPPVGLFVEAYEKALATAEEVISLHIAATLSGTIESARAAAEQFAGKVRVFDSKTLSWALGFQVMEAVAAAVQGMKPAEAVKRIERVRDRVELIVGLDSLDNLAKGGRIGRVSAFLGSFLNLKVTLMVDRNGEFQPVARTRGEKAALQHTLDWVAQHMAGAKRGAFAVGHALSEARAHSLAAAIRERFEVSELIIYETGSVIATHTGTGWGVAFVPEG
jgi:DegV family protein with EDD domain